MIATDSIAVIETLVAWWIVAHHPGLAAVLPLPSLGAVAVVIALRVETGRAVFARIGRAVVVVALALISGKSHGTYASVAVYEIVAFAAIFARIRCAIVDVRVTISTRVSRLTGAVIVVDQIDAGGAMFALTDAIVDILIAIFAGPSDAALAPIITDQVRARDCVYAGIVQALVRVDLADVSFPRLGALALVGIVQVDARAAILAGRRGALVDVDLTRRSGPSRATLTPKRTSGFHASPVMRTRSRSARIIHDLAINSRKAVRTATQIFVRFRVLARAAVQAWLVGTAVVQILVAQNSSPIGVADALP